MREIIATALQDIQRHQRRGIGRADVQSQVNNRFSKLAPGLDEFTCEVGCVKTRAISIVSPFMSFSWLSIATPTV